MTRRGQRGFTLIEAMISIAVIGVIGVIAARLFREGITGWIFNQGTLTSQQESRVARDNLIKLTRLAKASTVQISRVNSLQPPLSMLSYVDAEGNSRAFWQDGQRFMVGQWALDGSGQRITVTGNAMINRAVMRTAFFYGNAKDMGSLQYMIYVNWAMPKDLVKDYDTQLAGTIEIRNP